MPPLTGKFIILNILYDFPFQITLHLFFPSSDSFELWFSCLSLVGCWCYKMYHVWLSSLFLHTLSLFYVILGEVRNIVTAVRKVQKIYFQCITYNRFIEKKFSKPQKWNFILVWHHSILWFFLVLISGRRQRKVQTISLPYMETCQTKRSFRTFHLPHHWFILTHKTHIANGSHIETLRFLFVCFCLASIKSSLPIPIEREIVKT